MCRLHPIQAKVRSMIHRREEMKAPEPDRRLIRP
jgi:hypothetical protein